MYNTQTVETPKESHITLDITSQLWTLGARELLSRYGAPDLRITLIRDGKARRDIVYTLEGEIMVISNLPCRYNQ